MLHYAPTVFLVGDNYRIMAETAREVLFSVRVGDVLYRDHTMGVMNTKNAIHGVTVPREALEREGGYTLCLRPVVERKPYFTETEEERLLPFSFTPAPAEGLRAYYIADAHYRVDAPVRAAEAFGEIDLLVLGGDLIEYAEAPESFSCIFELCGRLTEGKIPVLFSRGNHDMRGVFAERFTDYTPTDRGRTYFTARIGSVWALVLDCGEDKADPRPEYGGTIACHELREEQTAFLKDVIANAKNEYAAEGVKTRLVFSHIPFTRRFEPPFDIEPELYGTWAKLIDTHICPDLMVCGHTHEHGVFLADDPSDLHPRSYPLLIASEPQEEGFIGCGLTFGEGSISSVFTDSRGASFGGVTFPKRERKEEKGEANKAPEQEKKRASKSKITLKPLSVLLLGLLAAVAAILFVFTDVLAPQKVTAAEYNALSTGMSYDEVIGLLGDKFKHLSPDDEKNTLLLTYEGVGAPDCEVTLLFDETDTLTEKTHTGVFGLEKE